jgi:hypothetical protein
MQAQSSQKDDYEAGAFLATVSFTTVSQLSEMNLSLFEDFCMLLTAALGSPKVIKNEIFVNTGLDFWMRH